MDVGSNPQPSANDNEITKHLRSSAEILGTRFLDHIVLGDSDNYFSYVEHGQI